MNETEQEPTPEEVPPSAEETPTVEEIKTEAQPVQPAYVPIPPPSRFKRFFQNATRWAVVILAAFLVGIAVMGYPLLRAQAHLRTVEKERDQANQTIATQNKELATLQNDEARLTVLQALSELRAARLALTSNDDVNVPLFVDKAAQVMKAAPASLLESEQATVTKIQQKIALAQEQANGDLRINRPTLDPMLADTIENLRNLDSLLMQAP